MKAIGVLEAVAAVGLILPAAHGDRTRADALAAVGIGLLMAGAGVVHSGGRDRLHRCHRGPVRAAAFVAWGRFGPYAF